VDTDRVMQRLNRQHGVISRQQALEVGMTVRQIDYRISSGRWQAITPGVYRHSQLPIGWHGRVLAACLCHGALASHRAAAALHEIDGYRPAMVDISVAPGSWRPVAGLVFHQSTQLDRSDPVIVDSIPCTGLARTVLDLAAVVPPRRLNFTIDAVLRTKRLTLPDLCTVLARHSRRGRDGCGRLREALDERVGVSGVPLSDWSRMVHDLLVMHDLPAPVMEHRVLREGGGFVAQVDLAYPAAKVAIELDSIAWHLNRESFELDPRRRNRLVVLGWNVLNFTWSDYVDRPEVLCGTVRSALRSALSAPTPLRNQGTSTTKIVVEAP